MKVVNSSTLDSEVFRLSFLQWIADNIGLNEFSPHNDFISQVGGALCSEQHPTVEDICLNALFIVCGFDSEQFNNVSSDNSSSVVSPSSGSNV